MMKIELEGPKLAVEPRMFLNNELVLMMALGPGWVEAGQRHSEMRKISFDAGEGNVCPLGIKGWVGAHDMEWLSLTISDLALRAANNGISGDMELPVVHNLADA